MAKATHKTDRQSIGSFQQIINVGAATAGDFQRLGFSKPQQLIGKDPLKLYQSICKTDGHFHDPCVLDVFMSTVDFMNGNPPKKWWAFTEKRKSTYHKQVDQLRAKYA